MAIIVNTLPAYVEEHRLPLISKAVIGEGQLKAMKPSVKCDTIKENIKNA